MPRPYLLTPPNSTSTWKPSVEMPEPMGDIPIQTSKAPFTQPHLRDVNVLYIPWTEESFFPFILYIQLVQGDCLSHRLKLFQMQVLTLSSNRDVGRVWMKRFSHRSSMTSSPSNKLEIGIPDYTIYFPNDTVFQRWRDLISHCSPKSNFPHCISKGL